MSTASYVYFIKPIGMDGPIKIGHSKIPTDRLLKFSIWSPYPLEIIGTVPGGCNEETYLHRCFSDIHSHREWFHSSPKLRDTIKLIVEANSIKAAKEFLTPKKPRGKKTIIVHSPAHKQFLDLQRQVREVERAHRQLVGKNAAWRQPLDVEKIVRRWNAQVYQGAGFQPTETELARVQEYLFDPAKHSIIPVWEQQFQELAAERQAEKIEATFARSREHVPA